MHLCRCIIKLGTAGTIFGFDIDTTNFNGNEAPQASVETLLSSSGEDPLLNDPGVSCRGWIQSKSNELKSTTVVRNST
jgi:allantoicase